MTSQTDFEPEFKEYIQVRANDFILQSVALDIAVSIAALASSSDKDEMFSQIIIQAKDALCNLSEERRTKGLKDYYESIKNEE